jgi:hypothetical protein
VAPRSPLSGIVEGKESRKGGKNMGKERNLYPKPDVGGEKSTNGKEINCHVFTETRDISKFQHAHVLSLGLSGHMRLW